MTTTSRSTSCRQMGDLGCSASCSRSSGAAAAATSQRCAWRSRNSARSTSRWGSHCRPASASAPTDVPLRDRRTAATMAPDLVAGRSLGAFGLTEPDGGSDAGATRTRAVLDGRRVGARRVEGVHHELRHRDHLDRDGRRRAPTTGSRLRRPGRDAGHDHRAAVRQARLARRDAHGITFDDCRDPGGEPARQAGPGIPQLPVDPRRRADRDLGAGARVGAGCLEMSIDVRASSATRSVGRSAGSRAWRSSSPISPCRSRTRTTSRTRRRG